MYNKGNALAKTIPRLPENVTIHSSVFLFFYGKEVHILAQAVYGYQKEGAVYIFPCPAKFPETAGRDCIEIVQNFNTSAEKYFKPIRGKYSRKKYPGKTNHSELERYDYAYIINLDTCSLDFFCKNSVPRISFSFETIFSHSADDIVSTMLSLDTGTECMDSIFDNVA